jgi:hypothetical protein
MPIEVTGGGDPPPRFVLGEAFAFLIQELYQELEAKGLIQPPVGVEQSESGSLGTRGGPNEDDEASTGHAS